MQSDPSVSPQELVQLLFLKHSHVVRGFVYGLLADRVRADDVLQETFLTLVRKAGDFDPGSNFTKWACTVARYKVLEERRRMEKSCGLLSPEVMESLAVTEDALNRDPRLERLGDCVSRLPEKMRRLVRLRYQEDHSPPEVAERIGWTTNSVNVALSRIRQQLRECIDANPSTASSHG